jgi:uncharacterized membrane protein
LVDEREAMQTKTETLIPVEVQRTNVPAGSRRLSVLDCWPVAAYNAIALSLLVWRLHSTSTSGHLSLPWDILLGWIPLIFAWLLHSIVPRTPIAHSRWWRRLAMVGLAGGWLLFFPNAPYLITELIHLDLRNYGPSVRPLPSWLQWLARGTQHSAPVWLDLSLLISVAACGVALTFASLRLVHRLIARRLSRRTTNGVVAALLFLASFGVALGRFDRFSSWDVFRKPALVAWRIGRHITAPSEQIGVTVCTLLLTALLTIGYFTTVARSPAR